MQQFQLWTSDTIHKTIKLADPKLISWNANSHPEQIALQRYLDDIKQELDPLPQGTGLFLHMEIDVKEKEHLLHEHDLDNYLYPIVKHLGAFRFRHVSAIKRVGGGSHLQIGYTEPMSAPPAMDDWLSFSHNTNGISLEKPAWKINIQNDLKNHKINPLKPGAVELQLIWKCSSQRNWSALWKPTIDAMGPVLGEAHPSRPFHPNDDRIVSLVLHLNTDDSIGWSVHIGMMWRSTSINLQ